MRHLFETVGIIDLYSDIYRQHSHTGKSRKLGGYCWSTPFKVLEVLFLGGSLLSFFAFKPTFKGVWSTAVNFAPLPSPDTKPGRYPQHHRRSDDSPGHHGLGS